MLKFIDKCLDSSGQVTVPNLFNKEIRENAGFGVKFIDFNNA